MEIDAASTCSTSEPSQIVKEEALPAEELTTITVKPKDVGSAEIENELQSAKEIGCSDELKNIDSTQQVKESPFPAEELGTNNGASKEIGSAQMVEKDPLPAIGSIVNDGSKNDGFVQQVKKEPLSTEELGSNNDNVKEIQVASNLSAAPIIPNEAQTTVEPSAPDEYDTNNGSLKEIGSAQVVQKDPSIVNDGFVQQVKKEPLSSKELESHNDSVKEIQVASYLSVAPIIPNEAQTNVESHEGQQTIADLNVSLVRENEEKSRIEVKTEPTSDDRTQYGEKGISSTTTTPERPTTRNESISETENSSLNRDNTATPVKDEPLNAAELPEGFFDDLLRAAELITEQMSPTDAEGVENMNDQNLIHDEPAPPAPSLTIERASTEPSSGPNNNETQGEASGIQGADPEPIPDNFFDDILEDRFAARRKIKSEITDKVVSNEAAAVAEAPSEDFFRDILQDRVAERISQLQNEEEEIKYAEKLKILKRKLQELDEIEEMESSNKKKKHKNKKAKKKSHKRSKNNKNNDEEEIDLVQSDDSEELLRKRKKHAHSSVEIAQKSGLSINKAIFQPTSADFSDFGMNQLGESTISYAAANSPAIGMSGQQFGSSTQFSPFPFPVMLKPEPLNVFNDANDDVLECLTVQQPSSSDAFNSFSGFKKIKLETPSTKVNIKSEESLPATSMTKRQKALDNAAKTISHLKSAQKNPYSSEFNFTSTVRKLPTSKSYVTQQIYDNRSPLHTINNVDYIFNSSSTRFNLHEWGLEAMPKYVAEVAKVIGYDADTLFSKLKAKKVTNKFNTKIKMEKNVGEIVEETKSSFFTNAMTQTDDMSLPSERKRKGHDFGVQAVPARASIGSQTNFPNSGYNSAGLGSNNDLPLMRLISQLNENQLLALNDFAELMREPASSTAMDMYHLRQRMLEIYKCSQMASVDSDLISVRAVAPPTNTNLNYHNEAPAYRATPISGNIQSQPNLPPQYSQRNPAAVSMRTQIPVVPQKLPTHQQATINSVYQFIQEQPRNADPRIKATVPQQPSTPDGYELPTIPPSPVPHPSVSGTKYYGRGAMRR